MTRRVITTYLEDAQVDALDEIAHDTGTSRSHLMREAVDAFLAGPHERLLTLQRELEDALDRVHELEAQAPKEPSQPMVVKTTTGGSW